MCSNHIAHANYHEASESWLGKRDELATMAAQKETSRLVWYTFVGLIWKAAYRELARSLAWWSRRSRRASALQVVAKESSLRREMMTTRVAEIDE